MMIMCLSVLPSFASAEENKEIDLLNGLKGYDSIGFIQPFLDNGNPVTNTHITFDISSNGNGNKGIYYDLLSESDISSFYVSSNGGGNVENNKPLAHFTFYDSNKKILGSDYVQVNTKGEFGKKVNFKKVRYVKFGYFSNASSKTTTFLNNINVMGTRNLNLGDIKKLNAIEGINDVSFTWENSSDSLFAGVKIYKEGSLVATVNKDETSYKVDGLEANKNYNFKFVAIYGDFASSGIEKGVKTLVDPKTIPPGPVSSLTAEATDKTVKLKWKSPKDDDLAGFKILQNGKEIAGIGLEEEFTVKNLQPLTDYTFGVISVDKDKNDSPPVSLSVKTLFEKDEETPHVPSNVFAKPSNGALIATWDKVSDKDLAGYNVYVDDKKVNSNLVSSTNFTIKNLENNRKYKIQVQAVDRSGNASALSLAAYGIPDEKTLPIIESNYSLQDVSDGVGVMFGQFWTVLAFAVGLPLAFYIIFKLKHVILP